MEKYLSWHCFTMERSVVGIGAVIFEDGKEIKKFIARCPIPENMKKSPLNLSLEKKIANISVTHESSKDVINAFFDFYDENNQGSMILLNDGDIDCAVIALEEPLYERRGNPSNRFRFLSDEIVCKWLPISYFIYKGGYKQDDEYSFLEKNGVNLDDHPLLKPARACIETILRLPKE